MRRRPVVLSRTAPVADVYLLKASLAIMIRVVPVLKPDKDTLLKSEKKRGRTSVDDAGRCCKDRRRRSITNRLIDPPVMARG